MFTNKNKQKYLCIFHKPTIFQQINQIIHVAFKPQKDTTAPCVVLHITR